MPIADAYRLLYSTVGYYPKQTKRALIRRVEGAGEGEEIRRCSAVLMKDGKVVWKGVPLYRGLSFGLTLWEVDFSGVTEEGTYQLVVAPEDGAGEADRLCSLAFPIAEGLFNEKVLKGLSLYNAESRYASYTDGGGYYDCNTEMGESFSHGRYLYGLADYWRRREQTLSRWESGRLRRAMDVAFVYLRDLWQEDGEIAHSWPRRFQADANPGIHNSYWSVMGMLSYWELFGGDPGKDEKFLQQMKVSVEYLERAGYNEEGMDGGAVPVYYRMHRITGEQDWLDKAVRALNCQCETFTLFEGLRFATPITEGLAMMLRDFPEHPDAPRWKAFASRLAKELLYPIRDGNAFRIMPSLSGGDRAREQWEHMDREPDGSGNLWGIRHFFNSLVVNTAYDALNIMDITGDESLEAVASGGIGWMCGINPGLPRWAVANPPAEREYEAAAMIANGPYRHAKAWTEWSFHMRNPYWQSVPNGYVFKEKTVFEYPDQWQSAESFLATDGVLLSVLSAYEDRMMDSPVKAAAETLDSPLAETMRILTGWWETCPDGGISLHDEPLRPGYVELPGGWRNGTLEAEIVLQGPARAGLVCRGRMIVNDHGDELAGYHILLEPENGEIGLYTRVAQLRRQASCPYPLSSGKAVRLAVHMEDEHLTVSINGQVVLELDDPRPMQPGHYAGCCGLYVSGGTAAFNHITFLEK